MDKQHIVQGVANKLWTAEHTIDAALVDASALVAEMADARKALRLSATADMAATAKILEAMAALGAARQAMVDAHDELGELKLRIGIRTKLIGLEDKTKKPGGIDQDLESRLVG